MAVNIDILIVAMVVTGTFIALRWLEHRFGHRFTESEYERKVEELERRVQWLLDELQAATARIRELERAQHLLPPPKAPAIPAKPLLVVCGPDNRLCEIDRQALRRVGISFQRIFGATQQAITDELRRRRQDGTLYTWLHITAHANEEGIHLSDGVAPPGFWNDALTGIDVVFLAACQSADVADALAGLVTVIYVLEDIDNRDASDFTYAFWRRMKEHGDPVQAYRQAVIECPQLAEFTDIRRS